MPDHRQAPKRGTGIDRTMRGTLVAFFVFCAVVIALVLGLGWKGLLHWTGELLLVIGISLAAKGISDVRREWTGRPGIWPSIKQKVQAIRAMAPAFLWVRWNRVVERWAWLVKRLHLRIHMTDKRSGDVIVSAGAATATGAAFPPRVVVSENLATEERLDKLENIMKDAERQISALRTWHQQEARDSQAAVGGEKAISIAEDQSTRESLADLAGGGLRLQAWGVVCLLAGTIMTAIWTS